MSDSIPKRSVIIAGHRTSVSLETQFWERLREMARTRNVSINELVTEIDANSPDRNLSSACRLYVLEQVAGAAA